MAPRRGAAAALMVALAVTAAAVASAAEGPHRKLQGTSFIPRGGKGSWANGGSTNVIFIYNNLMKDGGVMGWSNGYDAPQFGGARRQWATAVGWREGRGSNPRVLGGCGMHGQIDGRGECTTAFCAGVATTPQSDVLAFGGHRGPGLGSMKRYDYATGRITTLKMTSPKWYPGVATLPDGRIIVVGGVTRTAATECKSNPAYNNPTYAIYESPENGKPAFMSAPKFWQQLDDAWPHVAYPHIVVLPDGSLAVLAANTVANYVRSGPRDYAERYRQQPRPGPAWTYPNTGSGTPLPMRPPYDKVEFLAAGGSSIRCPQDFNTPASAAAYKIELTAGRQARWEKLDDMPFPRLMGDVVQLCDGTIFIVNGARSGKAGWCKGPRYMDFKDRNGYNCQTFCTCALGYNYEPVIFDPKRNAWSRKGSLAAQRSLRLYHSSAILLPSCKVMIAGSDTTLGDYAELYTPPYLSKEFGERPQITKYPASFRIGGAAPQNLTVSYTLKDIKQKIANAILIRTGTQTHSTQFDARSLWLKVVTPSMAQQRKPSGNTVTVEIPGCSVKPPVGCNVLVPGMYMLVLHSDRGAVSDGKIISFCQTC